MFDLATLHNLTGGRRGIHDVACPACGPECKSAANRNRKVLRVWDDGEFVTYKCARCEAKGWAKDGGVGGLARARPSPLPTEDKSELALFLWGKSTPAVGSIVQTYLTSRSCWVESAALRFLPGRGEHPPAMIARFGGEAVTGVHLTKLAADGSGKAGSDPDKVMIGPSNGQPIIICDNPDREELVIAEGIEDTASVVTATGWSGWAAGSAGRIPSVVAAAARYSKVYLAVDHDRAGKVALDRSLTVRPDLIPLRFAKMLGAAKENLDANKALIRFGAPVLLATIDLCEAQAAYVRREIGFHALQHAVNLAGIAYRPFSESL